MSNMEKYTVVYNKQHNYVAVTVNGFMPKELFIDAWNETFNTCKQHKCKYLLIDDSLNKVISAENQQWLLAEMLPLIAKTFSSFYVSQVMSANIFSQIASSNIAQFLPKSFNFNPFVNLELAEKWLIKQMEQNK